MKKVLKWIGIFLGSLVGIILIAATVLLYGGGARLNKQHDVSVEAVAIPSDGVSVARGRHLAKAVTLCAGCHGDHLEGKVLFDEPPVATVYSPNLTAGKGGAGRRLTDADFVRAIRHGINADGRGMMIMHADHYQNLCEADLGAIISYVKSVPPVDNELPPIRTTLLGRILVGLGVFDSDAMPLIPAELIDHEAPFPQTPAPGVTAEYGHYLVSIAMCAMCHGSDMKGGPPVEEGAPPGPNITIYGDPETWSDEQFINTLRTGVTPYGRQLNPEYMPWKHYGQMTDDELTAIRLYLVSIHNG